MEKLLKRSPIKFTLILLAILYILIFFLDVRTSSYIEYIFINNLSVPLFWYHIFSEGGFIEIIQWIFISLSIIVSSYLAGISRQTVEKKALIILSTGLALMLLEEIGNLRHTFRDIITTILGFVSYVEGARSPVGVASELIIYSLLGILMLIPLYLLIHNNGIYDSANRYLLLGYFFYGTASLMSASRNIGMWYSTVGNFLLENTGLANIVTFQISESYFNNLNRTLGFYFMDFLVEESLELIAISFILTALMIKYNNTFKKRRSMYPS